MKNYDSFKELVKAFVDADKEVIELLTLSKEELSYEEMCEKNIIIYDMNIPGIAEGTLNCRFAIICDAKSVNFDVICKNSVWGMGGIMQRPLEIASRFVEYLGNNTVVGDDFLKLNNSRIYSLSDDVAVYSVAYDLTEEKENVSKEKFFDHNDLNYITRPNFFCEMEVLNALISKEGDRDNYKEVDFTIDIIDAPYMVLYKAEEGTATVKVYKRGDVYTHAEGGYCIGTATLDKTSGGVSMDPHNSLEHNKMGTFVVACLKLNEYIQENNLSGMYDGLDAEKAGVLITQEDGELVCKVVAGKERPDIMCDTLSGGLQMCRPYIDENSAEWMNETTGKKLSLKETEIEESPFDVFCKWLEKEEQYGQFVIKNEVDKGDVTIRCVVTGTHHGERADRIEYITVGDSLTIKREFESPLNPDSIEVFNSSDESVGWIDVYMSDILAPLIDDGIVTIDDVTVASVMPKSQRGKRARAAELFINVAMNINYAKINNEDLFEEALNEEDLKEENLTEDDVPEEALKEDNLPEEDLAEEDVSEENLVEDNVLEEGLAEEDVPEENLVEDNLPEEGLAEEDVPEENLVEDNVLEEDLAEEDVSEESLDEKDAAPEVPQESGEDEQPDTRNELFVDIENQFKLVTKDELVEIATASAQKIIDAFSDGEQGNQVSLMLLVFGAKLGLVGDGVINEAEKELVSRVFGPIVDDDLSSVYDMIGNEIEESDYELVRVLTEMGNDVVMPFLSFILSFAYIDQVLEDEVAKRLDVLFGLNLLVEGVQSEQEDIPIVETQPVDLEAAIVEWFQSDDQLRPLNDIVAHFPGASGDEVKKVLDGLCDKGILYGGDSIIRCMYGLASSEDKTGDESLPVSKDESIQSQEGYKVVKEEETITVNDDFSITLQAGMYYATPDHVKLDEMAILNIGRLKEDKQDAAEGYIQINVNKDADFFGTFFAKEFAPGQYEQVLERFDFEKYLQEKTLQESNESEEQINEWATAVRVKMDFYSKYKVYKNEDNLKIGYYSNLIDGVPAYMIQIITRKALYMCNSVFTAGVLALGLREFLGDSAVNDEKFLDGILNSITLLNPEPAVLATEKAQLESSVAAEDAVKKQLDELIRETTSALHEIDKMWSKSKSDLQQQWLDKTYTSEAEVQMDADYVRKMIDTYAPLYEKLLDAYDESAEILWGMLKDNTSQLMCAEQSLEIVQKNYEGMDSLRYDFNQPEILSENTRSVSYMRSSDSVKEKWESRRDEARKQEELAGQKRQLENDMARQENQDEKVKTDKESEKQSQYEQIDADIQRQKEEAMNTNEQERILIEEKKNKNRDKLRLHRLELESLGAMRLIRRHSLEKIIREEESQDREFEIEVQASQIRLKDALRALDQQAEEKKRELLKELDEKYQVPKSSEAKTA